MNSGAQSARRRQAIIVFIIVLVIALGTMWVRMVQKKNEYKEGPDVERTDPDYMVEKFRYYRIQPDGKPQYEVRGEKLTHFPVEDAYKIEKPEVYTQNSRKQLQTIEADDAFIEDFNTKVHLSNSVKVTQEGGKGKAPRIITTEYLLVYPDDEVATSDREVTITQGKNVMKGVGMTANAATQETEMRGRVHVTLYPNGDRAEPKKEESAQEGAPADANAQPTSTNSQSDEP